MKITTDDIRSMIAEELENLLTEKCWPGYEKKGMKKMFGKMYPNCVKKSKKKNEEIEEEKNPRIPRKKGQPAKSKKHSDLYTDEDPKGTIHGLKFATAEDAKKSVSKIKKSGRSHAHKIQAAVAMEQRAKAAGKSSAAAVYRKYINSVKKDENIELDEKKKGGKKDGKGAGDKGYSLRDWFKGGGWVQTGGKYDGKPCAKQPGQKTKPYCRDPDDRAKLSKKEKNKRARKKRKEDPNPERRGKAKNVSQNKKRKKK